MAASDALIIVDDWISEHYATSDDTKGTFHARVRERVKQWRQEEAADEGAPTPPALFSAQRGDLVTQLVQLSAQAADADERTGQAGGAAQGAPALRRLELAEASTAVADRMRMILGFTDAAGAAIASVVQRQGPVRWLHPLGATEAAGSGDGAGQGLLMMVDALAVTSHEDLASKQAGWLTEPFELPDSADVLQSVSELLTWAAVQEDAPDFMLVLAGRFALLTSSDQWPMGRYLAVDLQTVAERNNTRVAGEVHTALTMLAAESLAPQPDGSIWWSQIREESVANAVGVSKDLRDGVRDSIEIIANEVVRRRKEQGLDPLADSDAQKLALQSLRYLYRILFVLHAEASPELGILPVGAPEFASGYSVDRLREMTLRPVPSRAADGVYLYESLQRLFSLINSEDGAEVGFENLEADLFAADRTALIDEVRLGNAALQQVLQNLLLSKEKAGRDRGFISYVALGINQLGAVYESLMSYTGSFARDTLVEVAPNGDASNGSWVVPENSLDESLQDHRVMVVDPQTGQDVPRRYQFGQFVYRLSGRARQESASYYSPEVLTRFTVSQGLAELLDESTTAQEILELTVCEPALGSGAFAIEAVRQLAEEYLKRRQAELGVQIEPEQVRAELQKVKAHIALHNVYGVDLNPTAVELAEVSLWLDSMSSGLKAPWFGLRLKAGNSLIGARRSVYAPTDLLNGKTGRALWTSKRDGAVQQAPRPLAFDESLNGRIFHFLLPGEGWVCAAENKEIKKLALDAAKDLRGWARTMRRPLSPAQVEQLQQISHRVERLWTLAARRLSEAEAQAARAVDVWGADTPQGGAVTRAEIEQALAKPRSAYRVLKLIMDAWCALWFWPVLPDDDVEPPTVTDWIDALQDLVGEDFAGQVKHRRTRVPATEAQGSFGSDEWHDLDMTEEFFSTEGMRHPDAVMREHPWLRRVAQIAEDQRFFHWELDFAPVFQRGGFDLQVGNPPWVRPDLEVDALLGEFDPWWVLTDKPAEAEKTTRRARTLEADGAERQLLLGIRDVDAVASIIRSQSQYSELAGSRPDLYRAFMVQTWRHVSETGVVTLVHPPTHFADARAQNLRQAAYQRLRRSWNFVNELRLFHDVHHLVEYGVHVYGSERNPYFLLANGLYHPSTAEGSLVHSGAGPEPGAKTAEGAWDLTPHRGRIQEVSEGALQHWHRVMEDGDPQISPVETRMLTSINSASAHALALLSAAEEIGSLAPKFSGGWNETTDRRSGFFERSWSRPVRWRDAILQGPYFHIGLPLFHTRNRSMGGNQDYTVVDLEAAGADYIPYTEYTPIYKDGDTARYDQAYGRWGDSPVRNHYRVFWRAMAAATGERTLIPAIYPPGTATVHSVFSFGLPEHDHTSLLRMTASMSTLLADFLIRATVGSGIFESAVKRLPLIPADHPLAPAAILRTLRLNCLTEAYADLWESCWDQAFRRDAWAGGRERAGSNCPRPALGDVQAQWSMASPLRIDEDRRQALMEIDAIMAIVTGISIDDLIAVYRANFAVLAEYDRGDGKLAKIYDANGRQIPSAVRTAWNRVKRPDRGIPAEDRTYTTGAGRTVEAAEPFTILDREADLRTAYDHFQARMTEQSDG